MGRPRSSAPYVVLSVRVPQDMEKRIRALGHRRASIVRKALKHGLLYLESTMPPRGRTHKASPPALVQRQTLDPQLPYNIANWVAQTAPQFGPNGYVPIGSLRMAFQNVPPPMVDEALITLEQNGVLVFGSIPDRNQTPSGGLEIQGRGLMGWVALRAR